MLAQTVSSRIVISTSTPNQLIDCIAHRYRIPCYINEGEKGIAGDWNYGLSLADTPYVTIAHQDDIYEPTYTAEILKKAQSSKHPLILFTDYFEIRNEQRVWNAPLLRTKRLMNIPLRLFPRIRWIRRRVLSFGNPICCPAVTFCTAACGDFRFDVHLRFACDWDAWERLSKKKGAFLYIPQRLMGHRIHPGSETTKQTAGTGRAEEEYLMFRRFWPDRIAKWLSGFYAKAGDSNQL